MRLRIQPWRSPLACALLTASVILISPRAVEGAGRRVDVRVLGEPLATALPRVGSAMGEQFRARGSIRAQRVSMVGRGVAGDLVRDSLKEMLSAPDAPVVWSADAEVWSLSSSLRRDRLAASLADRDLELYQRHLDKEVAWLKSEGRRRVAAAPPEERRYWSDRVATAALLDYLGDGGRHSLLSGEPVSLRIGALPPGLRELLREYVRQQTPHPPNTPGEVLDGYSLGLILARDPYDAAGTHLVESYINPSGRVWARAGVLTIPGRHVPVMVRRELRFTPPDPSDKSRRVTVRFPSAPPGDASRSTKMNLDQVLALIADSTGCTLISDGYLRPAIAIDGGLALRDYPLHQLLRQVVDTWDCDWRSMPGYNSCFLVRARSWWLEDRADIPQTQLQWLTPAFQQGKSPTLVDLLRLAELSNAQLHKLTDLRATPGSAGLVTPLFNDEANGKALLQFFSRLPSEQQKRALSSEGLPLNEVAPDLVHRWLRRGLIVWGAATQEAWDRMTYLIAPFGGPDSDAGFEVTVVTRDSTGPAWSARIGPRAPGRTAR